MNSPVIRSQYETYLSHVLHNGVFKADRTGTGTHSVFGYQMRFNMDEGFPLVTTKKVHLKSIIEELLWFLDGSTSNKILNEKGVTIWDEWAKPDGDLGPVYGKQWRDWAGVPKLMRSDHAVPLRAIKAAHYDSDNKGVVCIQQGIDQIADVLNQLHNNPDSRRIIVSAWNVADLPKMALAPCHAFFQFYSRELTFQERRDWLLNDGGKMIGGSSDEEFLHACLDEMEVPRRQLDLQLYQRSADSFLGVPFNIASYAFLLHMVAQQVGMKPGEFIWTGGDCHIYQNHLEQVNLQLTRTPMPYPKLKLNKAKDLFSYQLEDFNIYDYNPHPAIKAPVAV